MKTYADDNRLLLIFFKQIFHSLTLQWLYFGKNVAQWTLVLHSHPIPHTFVE